MKIAILSDIHGNVGALKNILREIQKENIENIIIAGDLVGECVDNDEVIHIVKELNPWIIKGNKEQYILDYHSGKNKHWKEYNQMAAMVWAYENMSVDSVTYIENLPEEISINLQGKAPIRVVHGSPGHMSKGIYQKDFPQILHQVASSIEEPTLICGHTHTQWYVEVDNKLIINPGGIGIFFNKSRKSEYGVLTWEGNKWNVDLRTVDFNIDDLEKRFVESGIFSEARPWCRIILESMRQGEFRHLEFIKFAMSLARERGLEKIDLIPNDIWYKAEKIWFGASNML